MKPIRLRDTHESETKSDGDKLVNETAKEEIRLSKRRKAYKNRFEESKSKSMSKSKSTRKEFIKQRRRSNGKVKGKKSRVQSWRRRSEENIQWAIPIFILTPP